MPEPLRVDVLLDRLCLTRSRSEAKDACDAGAVLLDGSPAQAEPRPSRRASGRRSASRARTLEIEVDALPPKSTSKKAARELWYPDVRARRAASREALLTDSHA